ncbi:hypothetical protein JCM6882_006606, partial [Rhodosporidiobolus microsporus]
LNLVLCLFSVANSRKEASIIVRGIVSGRDKLDSSAFKSSSKPAPRG